MILDQDSRHAPDTRRREGVGGAIFFRKIEDVGKERDSEGKGMGSGITNLRLDCTGVSEILSSIFFKVFFRTAHHQNQTEVVAAVWAADA